jgi:hypothetical protein
MAAIPKSIDVNTWRQPNQDWTIPPPAPSIIIGEGAYGTHILDIKIWENLPVLILDGSWVSGHVEEPDAPVREWSIEQNDIPSDEPYEILKGIPVKIDKDGEIEYTASFEEANLAIGGNSPREAFDSLIYEILDTFDHYSEQVDALGPEPQRQLAVLNRYIAKLNR